MRVNHQSPTTTNNYQTPGYLQGRRAAKSNIQGPAVVLVFFLSTAYIAASILDKPLETHYRIIEGGVATLGTFVITSLLDSCLNCCR